MTGFGGNGSKSTIISIIGKIAGSTNTGGDTTSVDTNGVEAKTVGSRGVPHSRIGFGTGGSNVAGGVGNSNTSGLSKRVIFLCHYLITMTGGSSNGDNVGGSRSYTRGKSSKIDG